MITPYLPSLGISRLVGYITKNITDRQMCFSQATQMRISTTKAVLDSIKNIKMMGLVEKMEARIQATRDNEIKQFIAFYRLMVAFFISCKLWTHRVVCPLLQTLTFSAVGLHLFSPAMTFIFYAIQAQLRGAKSFDIDMAFTSLAIIDIVCSPANALLGVLPEAASVIAAFDRIQTYLVKPSQEDKRGYLDNEFNCGGSRNHANSTPCELPEGTAIKFDHVTIRPASTADPVLKDISTAWKKGDLVVIHGAVGTGKTSLVKALLGYISQDTGFIQTAYRSVAYYSQVAWLINGTFKEVICGQPGDNKAVDEEWYERVVHVCGLEEDFEHMPDGDRTVIGSRGITLSGGQKHRVVSTRCLQRILFFTDHGCYVGSCTSYVRS